MKAAAELRALEPVSNDAAEIIATTHPYTAAITVVGTAPFLFHRWSCEAVSEKAKAAKGSKAKKTDDLETYVYRNSAGHLAIPTEYFRMALIGAAKFQQDPRSPRKSAMDLVKAGVSVAEEMCSLNKKSWDYVDQRRVMIQRNGVTRLRPAMNTGWKTDILMNILLPEYIDAEMLNHLMQSAGRLVGIGDFRPSYGRFQVTAFKSSV